MPIKRLNEVDHEYDELVRSGAQVEFDIARRRVYGRGAFGAVVVMLAGLFVGATFSFYMGWLHYPDVDPAVRTGFLMGVSSMIVLTIVLLVPGSIAIYRRHLARVSRRRTS